MATGSTNYNLIGSERGVAIGSTKVITICVVDENNNPQDITLATLWSQVREHIDDVTPVIDKATVAPLGIVITDGPDGLAELTWLPADTTRTPGLHCWDVLIEFTGTTGQRDFIVKEGSLVEFRIASTRGV